VFRDEEVVRRVVHAQSPRLVLEIIADRHRANSRQPSRLPEHGCNRALLDAADRARHNLPGCAVGLFSDVFDPSDEAGRLSEIVSGFDGFLFTRSMTHPELEVQDVTWVHGVEMPAGSRARLESEITRAAVRGAFTNVETVVVLSGDQGSNLLTELHVVSVAPHPGESDELIPGLHHAVSERVIQLARELGSEGREGKPVGCLFVMATPSAVQSYTHQLIVNPFLGYPEEQRNILDPSLAETIKEFAKIDGAFVIRPDGTVMSAGTYLAVSPEQLEHHPGEGARHASARAISAVAPAVAVTVSESTGRTSVYVGGRRRM
jgi:DNA integrity scanning protein DisA with diadenylate cyclase activity